MRSLNTDLGGLRLAIASDTWAPQLNGVTRTLGRLVAEARRRGADVRVFTVHDPACRQGDPDVTAFPSRPFWAYPQLRLSWPGAARLTSLWQGWRPDLVHAATPFGVGLAARAAARALDIPFATSYHTSLSQYAAFYRLGFLTQPGWAFLRWFHNSGLRTWCPTASIARDLEDRGFQRTAVWSRGVDAVAFSPTWRSAAFRREHGVGEGDLLVAYVGRIAREKGIDALMEGMHLAVRARDVSVRLMMVGDGPYEVEARAAAPPSTIFTGTLSGHALSTAFASADVFVFPSLTDTFGNVVLEAMSSGVPVLGADCPVTRELLGKGAGLLFREPSDLAAELVRLARSASERSAMAVRGRLQAETRTWDAVFDGLFGEYLELAGRGAGVRNSFQANEFKAA
ncbi:MAG: glycosyltransferase family 1 protein [Gemmatimonadetes bacterium]|nr:glycosyltransferase family 1 protein [Gemmatimonadota bacterium]